ncbi:hypothetical protein AQ490_21860 [Wenjunlia vitaminophila]|uniref:MFS transporter n=1 Tax=Wenjunlia vitaminophila TaxID=76728 RepID=A0A0T6LT34_WENVI|nr:MFS transporter [Wenjunlia vitaminophila]KRV48972.1 hypothetical protein AQ490_21860 [Wenjunlia vitaminophila]
MKERYSLGSYLAGAAVARTGDEMSGPALLLAGLAITGSPTSAALLLAGITVSAAVGGPVFGALLDRAVRPGPLLAGALTAYGTGLALLLVGLGRLPIAVTVAVAVVAGLLGPALSGGWTAQLPRVVPPEALPRANGLDAMTFNLASLVGPALAGVVAALCGASLGVVTAIVLIGLALPVAWRLPAARAREPGPASVGADLAAGFRCVWRTRPLARATVSSVVSCAGQGVLVACAPLLGERALGGADHGAVLLSGIAASALLTNAALARCPRPPAADTAVWGGAALQAGALLLAATGVPVLLVVGVLVAGAGEGPQLTALFAVRHREAPEHLRSQVFTTGASLKITGFAVGAAVAGPLAARSLTAGLLTAAGLEALAVLAFAAITLVGGRSR